MKRPFAFVLTAGLLLAPLAAQAAPRTVTLVVEKAGCALCAPVVKRALTKVPGVASVKIAEASPEQAARATVTFDDRVASIGKLTEATTNAGFPSRLAR